MSLKSKLLITFPGSQAATAIRTQRNWHAIVSHYAIELQLNITIDKVCRIMHTMDHTNVLD